MFRFVDGNDLRAAELRQILPGLAFELAHLPSGYSASAPDPATRARDKVLAFDDTACFAEAVDLTTRDGKSLRLELDSENESRFCRYWRETPAFLVLSVAVRPAAGAAVEVFSATVAGRIADKPFGARALGWDRLFVPDGETQTLAELSSEPDPTGLRALVYGELARVAGVAVPG
jgi:hypothetical protein